MSFCIKEERKEKEEMKSWQGEMTGEEEGKKQRGKEKQKGKIPESQYLNLFTQYIRPFLFY